MNAQQYAHEVGPFLELASDTGYRSGNAMAGHIELQRTGLLKQNEMNRDPREMLAGRAGCTIASSHP
jgi:hypothetical protein